VHGEQDADPAFPSGRYQRAQEWGLVREFEIDHIDGAAAEHPVDQPAAKRLRLILRASLVSDAQGEDQRRVLDETAEVTRGVDERVRCRVSKKVGAPLNEVGLESNGDSRLVGQGPEIGSDQRDAEQWLLAAELDAADS
jgi:hypothetical protein